MVTVRCRDEAMLAALVASVALSLRGQRLATVSVKPIKVSRDLWGFDVPKTVEDRLGDLAAAMGLSAVIN